MLFVVLLLAVAAGVSLYRLRRNAAASRRGGLSPAWAAAGVTVFFCVLLVVINRHRNSGFTTVHYSAPNDVTTWQSQGQQKGFADPADPTQNWVKSAGESNTVADPATEPTRTDSPHVLALAFPAVYLTTMVYLLYCLLTAGQRGRMAWPIRASSAIGIAVLLAGMAFLRGWIG
jgi:hypothetical protein